MKKLLIVISLALAFGASASGFAAGSDDPVPWPFANRCPFPWKDISGMWQVVGALGTTDSFEFTLVSTTQTGARIIEVNRYNHEMDLIATGRGISPSGQTIVRLAMYSVDAAGEPRSYTAFVGNYVERDKISCDLDRVHTVVTIRSYVSDAVNDSHYVIEKRGKNGGKQGQLTPPF